MESLPAALIAGATTVVAAWLILRAGAEDERRLQAALGITSAAARNGMSVDFSQLGRVVPDGLFLPLAWYPRPPQFDGPAIRAMKSITLLIIVLATLLATQELAWLVLVFFAAPLARSVVAIAQRSRAAALRAALEREVTSALDIVVIALEAGLPFDRAMSAYATSVSSPLADAFASTVRELEVGYRRRDALDRLAQRTGSASIADVARRVRLAEEFGTPLAVALRTLAVDLRATRRQRLQEAALRAPVTMLLPTAGFILLPIFAIILGPIALRVATGSLF